MNSEFDYMKKILLLLFAFSSLMAVAQNKSTVETRALIQNYKKAKSVGNMSKSLLDRFPVRQDKNGATIGVLAKVDVTFNKDDVENTGIKITSQVADIVVMRVPLEQLQMLDNIKGIMTYSISHKVSAEMDNTVIDTRTDSVHQGLGTPMPFDGEGVLIGITDWGFDYTHPNINKMANMRI